MPTQPPPRSPGEPRCLGDLGVGARVLVPFDGFIRPFTVSSRTVVGGVGLRAAFAVRMGFGRPYTPHLQLPSSTPVRPDGAPDNWLLLVESTDDGSFRSLEEL